MSIISSIKKAIGFPEEYDEEMDLSEEPSYNRPTISISKTDEPIETSTSGEDTTNNTEFDVASANSDDLIGFSKNIFDELIQMFNSIQPDFVKQCLNTEQQRIYIVNHLSDSIKQRMAELQKNAHSKAMQIWESDKQRLSHDIERIKSEYQSLKLQREEFKNAQLSASRQKRALTERVHDLESQVSALEAEKEQFQLETRSMQNKLRLANLRGGTTDSSENDSALNNLISENDSLKSQIESLNNKITDYTSEIEQLKQQLESVPANQNNDINEAQQAAIAEIESQLLKFEEIKQKKDRRISELTQKNAQLSDDAANLLLKLTQAQQEIQKKESEHKKALEKATSSSGSANAEIKELRAEIQRLTQIINAANADASSISDIAPGVQAIKPQPAKEEPKIETAPKQIKISAIDDLLDSTDWFTAPEPVPLAKDPEVDEDFGYKEPTKKTSHDDDKQLSLF